MRLAPLAAFALCLSAPADPAARVRHEAAGARVEAARAEAAAERARVDAARLRADSAALVASIDAAETRIGQAEAALAKLRAAETQARARLASKQAPLLRLTAAMQAMARRPAALALVQPGSTADYVRLRAVMDAAVPAIRARTAALRAEVEAAGRLSARAAHAAASLASERDGLRRKLVALAQLERRALGRADDLLAQAMTASDRSLALGEDARALESEAERRRAAAQVEKSLAGLPSPPDAPNPPPSSPFAYRLPVKGKVLAGTGALSEAGIHARGITLAVAAGAPVVAPRRGRVAYAGRFRSYGEVVIIDHGEGWTSTLTGLSALAVRPGAQVTAGQRIGRASRQVTLELRKDGQPRDIAPLLHYG